MYNFEKKLKWSANAHIANYLNIFFYKENNIKNVHRN